MEEVLHNMKKIYTTINLEYEYSDLTNPEFPFLYKFASALVMQRNRNILIPEEDQQAIIEDGELGEIEEIELYSSPKSSKKRPWLGLHNDA